MGYKMGFHDMAKDVVAKAAGSKTKDDVLDAIRKKVVNAMLHGTNLGIGVGNGSVDFNGEFKTGPTNWDSSVVFNFEEFRKKDNYREILMEEDLKDIMGNKCQKSYWD